MYFPSKKEHKKTSQNPCNSPIALTLNITIIKYVLLISIIHYLVCLLSCFSSGGYLLFPTVWFQVYCYYEGICSPHCGQNLTHTHSYAWRHLCYPTYMPLQSLCVFVCDCNAVVTQQQGLRGRPERAHYTPALFTLTLTNCGGEYTHTHTQGFASSHSL